MSTGIECEPQITNIALMISPDHFAYDPVIKTTNAFRKPIEKSADQVKQDALGEFASMASLIVDHGMEVINVASPPDESVTNAVFPNNWFSHHGDTMVIYPMAAPKRQLEKQPDAIIDALVELGLKPPMIVDLSSNGVRGQYLEGTGSLVLDRTNNVAFSMESPRTSKKLFGLWCQLMGYKPHFFHAYDKAGKPIYHTNVVMSIGETATVACLDSVTDLKEKQEVKTALENLGKEVIPISLHQVTEFCGNVLWMKAKNGDSKLVISSRSVDALTTQQKIQLEKHGQFVPVDIPTIEGKGGSARCMIAEIFGKKI